jgi:HK97 family phage portal protein
MLAIPGLNTRKRRAAETRDSAKTSTLKEPEAWLLRSFGASGVSVNADSALSIATVYACVRILAESVASLPLKLYRKANGTRDEVMDHPLNWLVKNEPNEYQTSFEFREQLQGHLGMRGNAYARLYRDPFGEVIQIEPLHPADVQVLKNEDTGRLIYRHKGTTYGAYDILHIKGLTTNGLIGLSPVTVLRETFGLALSSQKHGLRTFENNATPGGVIETPGTMTPEQVSKLREEWDKHHKGVANSGRPAILYGGMKFAGVGFNSRDAQFLESRKFDVEEIARAYRIPLHLLQSTEKSTSWGSGIEQQNIGFIEYTLRPWLVRWEQALNRVLLTEDMKRGGYYFKFNLDALLRGDFKTRMEGWRTGIETGMFSINEAREKEDWNPIGPEGDVHYRPLNTTPANQLGEEAPAPTES